MDREMIIVLDFGGQYNQLIARRVRECNVYCEVHPYNMSLDKIKEMNPKGIISQADRMWYLKTERRVVPRRFLNWGYRFLESATEPS